MGERRERLLLLLVVMVVAMVLMGCISSLEAKSVPLADTECYLAPSTPGDRRTDTSKLTIATYNTEFLFYDRYNCPGTGCPWNNATAATTHFKSIATELQRVNADIVSLEEVQDCIALKMLIENLPSDFGYKPYLIQGTDTSTGQNVGLLTRVDPYTDLKRTNDRRDYPLSGSKCGSDIPVNSDDTTISKHYYTFIKVNGVRILFIGLHLIAFPVDPNRCSQREAQASLAQKIVQSEQGNFDEVVILGDFNDYSGTVIDAAGDKPTSRVLEFLGNPLANGDLVLTSVVTPLPQSLRYSAWYDENDSCVDEGGKENTMIDHLLVSPGLYNTMTSSQINHAYNASCYEFYSDHWPVVATFSV